MRVLHIIPSISPLRGGPSQAVIEMVKELRRQGVDASIVTTRDNGIYRDDSLPTGEWTTYRGVPIMFHSCIDSKLRSIREYLVSPSLINWLIRNIEGYDLIHFHAIFSFTSTIGMLVARRKKMPYIIRTIGQLNKWSLHQGFLRKRLMLMVLERQNLNKASAIHVTSQYELTDIEEMGINSKKLLLGLGVDLPEASSLKRRYEDFDQKQVNFLFLSRIHPKKQIELLFRALKILKSNLGEANWKLFIAGTGSPDYLVELKEIAKTFCIDDHLHWAGHVSGLEKQNLIGSSDWFVLTSASENFGISAVEAMASSLPVIISENVGISDKVIQYSAGYVCQEDPAMIANILKEAIQTCDHTPMKSAARKLVEENYSWQYVVKSLSFYYLTLSRVS